MAAAQPGESQEPDIPFQACADLVLAAAETVLRHRPNAPKHWHLVAGIVLCKAGQAPVLASLASGTRCTPPVSAAASPTLVRDCHAEVHARRAFNAHLLEAVHAQGVGAPWIQKQGSAEGGAWRWNPAYAAVLVISDAPCGDAAVRDEGLTHRATRSGFKPTGAKPVLDPDATPPPVAAAAAQASSPAAAHRVVHLAHSLLQGRMRTKSARTDLALHKRSHCLSCSDKVARWCGLGLAGGWASSLLGQVPLSGIVICADDAVLEGASTSQRLWAYGHALHRAVIQRQPVFLDHWRSSQAGGSGQALPWEGQSPQPHKAPPLCVVEELQQDALLLKTALPGARLPTLAVLAKRFSMGRHTSRATTGVEDLQTSPECFNWFLQPTTPGPELPLPARKAKVLARVQGPGAVPTPVELLNGVQGGLLGSTKRTSMLQRRSRLAPVVQLARFLAAAPASSLPPDAADTPYGTLKAHVAAQHCAQAAAWSAGCVEAWPSSAPRTFTLCEVRAADAADAAQRRKRRREEGGGSPGHPPPARHTKRMH